MKLIDIFKEYASERRLQKIEGFQRTDEAYLVRYTPQDKSAGGLVTYADLTPGDEKNQIQKQISYFVSLSVNFEWKIHEFDSGCSLKAILENNSFIAGEEEAFMIFDIQDASEIDKKRDCSWEIRNISDLEGVSDVVYVQENVWDRKFDWLADQLLQNVQTSPESLSVYCAYYKGNPIGTGWTEFPENSKFPELHGGAVMTDWRGRGVYSDIYDKRIREARTRGFRYLAVDASLMSRPILEKLGFKYVCKTYPMRHDHT
jgi:GNAT superfamily N-acetyltransferase